ncbi:MAG TPA: ATP-binding cassette domain-containing protein, partial [Planctomycetota bacterium]|nr:ATP-binding cassette domain-containing protein [Planctomycetota bacterium]
MSRAPAILRLNKVSRWYGDVLALDDIELEIGPGVTGLLGPNGAGKSTLIRLVVGLASPGAGTETMEEVPMVGAAATAGAGSVTLDGQVVRNNIAALARIGYVPDGDGLYEEQTARRFLVDQARLRGFSPSD